MKESRFVIAAGELPPPGQCIATVRFPQRGGLVKVEVGTFTALGHVPERVLGYFLQQVRQVLEEAGYTPRLICTLPLQIN